MHPSAGNMNSANFACTEFSETPPPATALCPSDPPIRDACCLDQGFSERTKPLSPEFALKLPFGGARGQTHRVFELHTSWRQADEATPPIRRVNLSPDVALVLEVPEEVVYRLL